MFVYGMMMRVQCICMHWLLTALPRRQCGTSIARPASPMRASLADRGNMQIMAEGTRVLTIVVAVMVTMTMTSVVPGSGSAPLSRSVPFMVAGAVGANQGTAVAEGQRRLEVSQKTSGTLKCWMQCWMQGHLSEKLKIATLGRRRARSGKSRCLEETLKFLESCASGGGHREGNLQECA
mmetsp:Transcript_99998/g.322321  ORF Transcript_99998/g.322321 Transcript_99998/m.322321 type:complete len:179 (-) Transcript_99998:51-587(-)